MNSLTKSVFALATGLAIAGCATTQEAERAMSSRFVGHPSDQFFSRYGAPQASFAMHDGQILYTWRGGQSVRHIPAEYKTIGENASGVGSTTTKTTKRVSHPSPTETVTTTKSKSVSTALTLAPQQVMVSPARDVPIFCEAQLTVDAQGIITAMRVTQDTEGKGFSLSRCAELFEVK